jgi:HD-GYP domain-containing protein (c-di-GMP phosphodiesterase class II)
MHTQSFENKPIEKTMRNLRNRTTIALLNKLLIRNLEQKSKYQEIMLNLIIKQTSTTQISDWIDNLYSDIKTISGDSKFSLNKFLIRNSKLYKQIDHFKVPSYSHQNEFNLELVMDKDFREKLFESLDFNSSDIITVAYFDESSIIFYDENINFETVIVHVSNLSKDAIKNMEIYFRAVGPHHGRMTEIVKKRREFSEMFQSVGSLLDKREDTLGGHITNVEKVANFIASKYLKEEIDMDYFSIACNMHDIGKVFIPERILSKPGKLTSAERKLIQHHTTNIFKPIRETNLLEKMIHNVVRYHHERWDGKGYPEGLKREEIPLEARLVAPIDVLEALTHYRVYKEPWTYDKAFNYLKTNRGTQFDPYIIDILLQNKDEIIELFSKANSL